MRESQGGQIANRNSTIVSGRSSGADASWLIGRTALPQSNRDTKSYIGIDFGTSTSVVSVATINDSRRLHVSPLVIDQPGELGESIQSSLVPSVLAFRRGRLLHGQDAYRLKPSLKAGVDVFSSFKLRLGVDLGPIYPTTKLPQSGSDSRSESAVIETAQDAAREFFIRLRAGILAALRLAGHPEEFEVAVSVPASFEANQRRDLQDCLREAGFGDVSVFVDEPNAAFLSYMYSCGQENVSSLLGPSIVRKPTNILVYDFGAGTCDVSILEISMKDGVLKSRNRAISQFVALGGDDFDREIAEKVLLPQLMASAGGIDVPARSISERLVPALAPAAEDLKIAASTWMQDHKIHTLNDLSKDPNRRFTVHSVGPVNVQDRTGQPHQLSLTEPSMSLGQFANALEDLLNPDSDLLGKKHIFAPLDNAISKAEMSPNDVDAVLFIGGSVKNPVVRHAVMTKFPESTIGIVPDDLQTHVSIGASIHSLAYNGMGVDFIRPISSEPIYVVTKGGVLDPIVPAGTPVPSPEISRNLMVESNGQRIVDLPLCVGNLDRMLGIVRVEADNEAGFAKGQIVDVRAKLTQEKLLDVVAWIGQSTASAELMNPLSNETLGQSEINYLKARQRYNKALLNRKGSSSPDQLVCAFEDMAHAAFDCGRFEEAADGFQQAERLAGDGRDHSINIGVAYGRAGKQSLSTEWKEEAARRNPHNYVALYNLSLDKAGSEQEELLKRSLRAKQHYPPAQLMLGRVLKAKGDPLGDRLLADIVERLLAKLEDESIKVSECECLLRAAKETENHEAIEKARNLLETRKGVDGGIQDDNLVRPMTEQQQIRNLSR